MKKLKVIAILLAITTITNVHAVLQSRDEVAALVGGTATEYFKKSREMEAEGGILGLNATFATNATTGEYEETSASNNIDPHMVKNTEWGAVAMLSASNYGAGAGNMKYDYDSSTLKYGVTASTTGNMSGIFGMNNGAAKYEFMASGIISAMNSSYAYRLYNNYLIKAHSRYVDSYVDGSSSSIYDASSRYIPGDATYETKTFSGGGGSFVYSSSPVFIRSSVLSFDCRNGNDNGSSIGSRVVVWVGAGL